MRSKSLTFNLNYFLISGSLFVLLTVIAFFVKDQFIRPFVGDMLAVVWVYALLKTCLTYGTKALATVALAFAFLVEILQYVNVISLLNLEEVRLVKLVLGATFDWLDLVAYFCGFLLIICVEQYWTYKHKNGIRRN